MFKEIFLDAPNVGKQEKKYLNEAVDTGFVSTVGPFVDRFEKKFARYIGAEKAVSTQSGTAAIHMALHELGIGPGDEVIVPVLTFIATVNPVMYVGARPVFADVDKKTWNIDAFSVEELITRKTRAIIPVHLYGNPCDMGSIMAIAKKHGLAVIEDATESLGAKYDGKHTGTFGDIGCFSFNGNKTITTGGGGMVTGRDAKKVEHIKFLVNQAREDRKGYYHPEIGFNYRMTNVEAALGLAQMESLEAFLKKKKIFDRLYRRELGGLENIHFQEKHVQAESSCWMSSAVIDGCDTVSIQKSLQKKGIMTRRVFIPLTEFPPYRKMARGAYKNAYYIHEGGLNLPSSTLNSEEDVIYVCDALKDLLRNSR